MSVSVEVADCIERRCCKGCRRRATGECESAYKMSLTCDDGGLQLGRFKVTHDECGWKCCGAA